VPIPPSTWGEPTAIYRLFDRSGSLLYVGVSVEPRTRIKTHIRDMPWGREVDGSRTRIEWAPDRPTALAVEASAIAEEAPAYNVTGSEKAPRPRQDRDPMPYDNLRRVRIDRQLWDAYGTLVGTRGRSADIRTYMAWRAQNPTTPLPGEWRGPVKRVRARKS
jgi:hypothetical protein